MSTSETAMYEWDALPWPRLERSVFKLQKRIYQAARQGDVEKIHKLQRLLIKSRAAILLAVRRVAQDSTGKRTAGIDGFASLNSKQKLQLAEEIRREPLSSKAQPVRRVWIPKPGKDEKRPLGIPVMKDRARQALAKLALEPEWEARFEPNSYGFRPGRSCHDAVAAIYLQMRTAPKFVLDADISGCFDHINHEVLLDKLGTFPGMRRAIRAWLKAGLLDGEELFPTSEGTPQGGVISPLLMNVALHGFESAIEDAFQLYKCPRGQRRIPWKPKVIRYADDFVIFHRDREAIERAKQIAADWLQGIGLEMKPSKTRITHTLEAIDGPAGFEFLGFHFRLYPRGKTRCMRDGRGHLLGFTPSIRPSQSSQKRLLLKIREIIRSNRNVHQAGLIRLLNPVIRGWGNYFSAVVSKDVFQKMDMIIYRKLWSWAIRRHPNKGRRWIAHRYWLLGSGRGWTFGINGKITLHKLSEIPIRRHVKVLDDRSPFDGDAMYWSARLGTHPELPRGMPKFLKRQKGVCPGCGMFFKPGDRLEVVRNRYERSDDSLGQLVVVHDHCQNLDARCAMTMHHSTEEPDEGKLSRPVLKTSTGREARA
jgi:RNA-directed DNA polymerase